MYLPFSPMRVSNGSNEKRRRGLFRRCNPAWRCFLLSRGFQHLSVLSLRFRTREGEEDEEEDDASKQRSCYCLRLTRCEHAPLPCKAIKRKRTYAECCLCMCVCDTYIYTVGDKSIRIVGIWKYILTVRILSSLTVYKCIDTKEGCYEKVTKILFSWGSLNATKIYRGEFSEAFLLMTRDDFSETLN